MNRPRSCLGVLCFCLLSANANADCTNTAYVCDASGTWTAGGPYSNLFAFAQPGGVGHSRGGQMVNRAGFLNAFCLYETRDCDGDGVADENDMDNDNDGLEDGEELAGTAFDPVQPTAVNTADTDGDGMEDGAEAKAETDPLNDAVYLHITDIAAVGCDVALDWQCRSGMTYRVFTTPDLAFGLTNLVADDLVATSPASPPWYTGTSTWYHGGGATGIVHRFYRIQTK